MNRIGQSLEEWVGNLQEETILLFPFYPQISGKGRANTGAMKSIERIVPQITKLTHYLYSNSRPFTVCVEGFVTYTAYACSTPIRSSAHIHRLKKYRHKKTEGKEVPGWMCRPSRQLCDNAMRTLRFSVKPKVAMTPSFDGLQAEEQKIFLQMHASRISHLDLRWKNQLL